MTFIALLPGRTSTSFIRLPTTSFSRSRRRTSSSGSAGIGTLLEPLKRASGRVLFRFLLGASRSLSVQLVVEVDVSGEALGVIRSGGRDAIGGAGYRLSHGPLLL